MCPHQTHQSNISTSLTAGNNLTNILNLEQEFRTAFPPWSTLDISKSIEDVVARSQPKIKGYGQLGYKAFRWLFPRRLSSIEALPDDILVEIFRTLGWREVLSLRQTCKRLQKISRAKTIWLAQLEQLSLALPVSPKLEHDRDAYSGQEVEDFVCSRISADIGWVTGEAPRPRTVSPWPKYQDPNYTLVEGGRWLLIADGVGRVYAEDLDAPSGREPELIIDVPPQDAQNQYSKQYYYTRVDVDRNEPVLTFNLSLLPYRNKKGLSNLRIYRVQLTGHGNDARLVSRFLNHFPLNADGFSPIQDLSGNFFARIFEPSRHNRRSRIEVYDWTLSNHATQFMAFITKLLPAAKSLAILPGSKILGYQEYSINIYNIVKLVPVEGQPSDEETLETFWTYGFMSATEDYCHVSRPLRGSTATRIAVSDGKQIFGVTVPHNGSSPSAHLLSNDSVYQLLTAGLGINKMYAQYEDHSCTINFIWPDDDRIPSSPLCNKRVHIHTWPFKFDGHPLFDEGSGRVVSKTVSDGWKILDFTGSKTSSHVAST